MRSYRVQAVGGLDIVPMPGFDRIFVATRSESARPEPVSCNRVQSPDANSVLAPKIISAL
jgi:hypothetical protein